ncbi:MAG: hypothetical protein ACO3DQ_06490 [Cephaloticoccus sp.]
MARFGAFVPGVRRITALISLGLAWLCANGALWDAVQVFAWGKMVHDYAQVMPLPQAIAKTFDGNASCEICVVVDDAKATTSTQQVERTSEKVVLACEPVATLVVAGPAQAWPGIVDYAALTRTEPVALRPPRV